MCVELHEISTNKQEDEQFQKSTSANWCASCFFLPEGRTCVEGASSSERPHQLASAELSKPCTETMLRPGQNNPKAFENCLRLLSTETKILKVSASKRQRLELISGFYCMKKLTVILCDLKMCPFVIKCSHTDYFQSSAVEQCVSLQSLNCTKQH